MDALRFFVLATIILLDCTIRFATAGQVADAGPINDPTKGIITSLKVTTWNDMPYSGIELVNGQYVGKGIAFYILDLISEKLNFTYTVVPPDQHVIGDKNHGIMKMLSRKEIDLVAAFLPALPQLQQFCVFSTPLDESKITALMRRPHESATGSGLLAPFDENVWWLLVASMVFTAPIIYIFALVRRKLWKDTSENYSLPSCLWFLYSSLVKQGTNIIATSDSTRMLFATWWLFILVLTSFYTANLTAFLTKPQFTLPIYSLRDIAHKGYWWATYKGRTIEYLLTQETETQLDPLKRTAYYKGQYITEYENPLDKIVEIVNNKILFLAEDHYLNALVYNDYVNRSHAGIEYMKRCVYVVMPGHILALNRAFAYPMASEISKRIDKELLDLVQAGLVHYLKRKDLPLVTACPVDIKTLERQLRNADLATTYRFVIGGYVSGGVAFVLELMLWLTCCLVKQRKRGARTCNEYCSKPKRAPETPEVPIYTTENHYYGERPNLFKRSPPPIYHDELGPMKGMKQINGRDYFIVHRGDSKLAFPARTPDGFFDRKD